MAHLSRVPFPFPRSSSLIFLQTEMVGVCKFKPPLVSSCHRSLLPVLLLLLSKMSPRSFSINSACPPAQHQHTPGWPRLILSTLGPLQSAVTMLAEGPVCKIWQHLVAKAQTAAINHCPVQLFPCPPFPHAKVSQQRPQADTGTRTGLSVSCSVCVRACVCMCVCALEHF